MTTLPSLARLRSVVRRKHLYDQHISPLQIGSHRSLAGRLSSTMSKPSVLLIGPLAHADKDWQALGSKYTLKEYRQGDRQDFLQKLKSDFNDIVGMYRSNVSVDQTGRFDKELCAALPQSLNFVAHNGAGYDNIDVEPFTERGIQISSTPIAVDNATADVGIFIMLGALRYATIPLMAIRAGQWRGDAALGHDPNEKVLGILGMGGIGRVSVNTLCELLLANTCRPWPIEHVHSA